MTAAAMELKALGLCNKAMFVVPNHLTEQWAAEFLQLYPAANILVATKKDFEASNRKRFCGRIATGEYLKKSPFPKNAKQRLLKTRLTKSLKGLKP